MARHLDSVYGVVQARFVVAGWWQSDVDGDVRAPEPGLLALNTLDTFLQIEVIPEFHVPLERSAVTQCPTGGVAGRVRDRFLARLLKGLPGGLFHRRFDGAFGLRDRLAGFPDRLWL
ncbi:hypothetical protein EGD98_16170 [Halomicroarcula sp. F24A]|uniref:Uncharacterized protein n=1 Tax=Haloarcula salinisoli TaxID=2487746 RepID=A0A8J8C939_9EURY|nr:hypothetical protein [Halomicroarcula salinisoli]MBX0305201.1 hypothetical protein [Halomicroarcula salinisoli]